MAKGSTDATLKEAFTSHLRETQGQAKRLEEIAGLLATKLSGKKCVGMEGVIGEGVIGEGVIGEGAGALEEDADEAVLDLGLIGAGSRVEHYEIAGYLTAIGFGETQGPVRGREPVAVVPR